jgi:hypothetical protein
LGTSSLLSKMVGMKCDATLCKLLGSLNMLIAASIDAEALETPHSLCKSADLVSPRSQAWPCRRRSTSAPIPAFHCLVHFVPPPTPNAFAAEDFLTASWTIKQSGKPSVHFPSLPKAPPRPPRSDSVPQLSSYLERAMMNRKPT